MQDLCCSLWNIVEACGIFSCSTWDLHCGIQALFVCGRQDLRCSMWGLFLLWYVGSLLQHVGFFFFCSMTDLLNCNMWDSLVGTCEVFLVAEYEILIVVVWDFLL